MLFCLKTNCTFQTFRFTKALCQKLNNYQTRSREAMCRLQKQINETRSPSSISVAPSDLLVLREVNLFAVATSHFPRRTPPKDEREASRTVRHEEKKLSFRKLSERCAHRQLPLDAKRRGASSSIRCLFEIYETSRL